MKTYFEFDVPKKPMDIEKSDVDIDKPDVDTEKTQAVKLAIVGSRKFADKKSFTKWIEEVVELWGRPEMVISGGASGADTLGERWAREEGIEVVVYKPDWNKYGKAAGIIRNRDIIGRATHMLALPSRDGRGTQHSISLAEEQDKPLLIHWID